MKWMIIFYDARELRRGRKKDSRLGDSEAETGRGASLQPPNSASAHENGRGGRVRGTPPWIDGIDGKDDGWRAALARHSTEPVPQSKHLCPLPLYPLSILTCDGDEKSRGLGKGGWRRLAECNQHFANQLATHQIRLLASLAAAEASCLIFTGKLKGDHFAWGFCTRAKVDGNSFCGNCEAELTHTLANQNYFVHVAPQLSQLALFANCRYPSAKPRTRPRRLGTLKLRRSCLCKARLEIPKWHRDLPSHKQNVVQQ